MTAEVIAAFKHLVQVFDSSSGCTCEPIDWDGEYWKERARCASCQVYDAAEAELVGLLNLKPYECLQNPYLKSPYPPGSPAAQAAWDHPVNRRGRALWRALEAASGVKPERATSVVASDDVDA
jgi:hypothetical protein